jgi:hypothetical protein
MSVGGAGISGGGAAPQIDANALMELLTSKGGAQAQIAEYQTAKQAYEKAYADLQLGRSARDVLDNIEATKADAKKKIEAERAAFQKEMESEKRLHQNYLDSTKEDIQNKLKEAQSRVDQGNRMVAEQAALNKAVVDAKHEAEADMAKAQLEVRKAKSTAGKAEDTIREYTDLKSKLDAAIKAIKSAAASI